MQSHKFINQRCAITSFKKHISNHYTHPVQKKVFSWHLRQELNLVYKVIRTHGKSNFRFTYFKSLWTNVTAHTMSLVEILNTFIANKVVVNKSVWIVKHKLVGKTITWRWLANLRKYLNKERIKAQGLTYLQMLCLIKIHATYAKQFHEINHDAIKEYYRYNYW